MSTDKLQAVHEAIADVFNDSPPISTDAGPSHPVFDHETLSEIFSKPHLISANTERSSHIFDHATLAGIFSEPLPILTNTKPSIPSFDQQALAGILHEVPPTSTNTKSLIPSFEHQALAEFLSEPPPTSTDTKQSPPSFDHQALAEMLSEPPLTSTNSKPSPASFDHEALTETLSELHPVPINPQKSPRGFDTGSSSGPHAGQLDNGEPAAKTVAVAPSTNAESERPQRAKSLLAELHHIFSTKAEPPPSSVETDPSPPFFSGHLHTPEPVANAIAAASPIDAENARSQHAESLLTVSPLIPTNEELPTPAFEQAPSSPRLTDQPGNVRPAVSDAATSPTETTSARPQRARSLLAETSSLISTKMESSPPIFEKESLSPTVAGQLDNVYSEVKAVAAAAPADAENAQPQQANSSLTELPPLISTNTKPPPPVFEMMPSQPILSGQLDNLEPAANATPTDAESAGARQAKSFLTELRPLISVITETSPLIREKETSRPTLSGQPDNVEPAAQIVAAAPRTDTESARPQQARSLLVPSLISTDTKPSPPNFQTEPSPPTLSGQLDKVGPAASTVAAVPPTYAESARPQRATSLLAELPPMISAKAKPPLPIFEKEPWRPTLSSQPNNLEPAARAVSVAPPTDAESAVMQPREAKTLLSAVPSLGSTNIKWPPNIFENEPGQAGHAEPAGKIVAAAPPADAEGARPQQAKSLLAELPPSRSFFERKSSPTTLSGELDNVAPAVKTVAGAPPTHAVAMQPQQTRSLADLPALVPTNTKPSPPIFEEDSPPPSLSGQQDKVEPAAKTVVVAHPTDAESALPLQANSSLAALRALIATKPSASILEKEPSRSTLAGQPDNVGMSVKNDAESALPQQAKSLLTEMSPLISSNAKQSRPIFEKNPSRPPVSDQPANVEPTAKAVAVAPPVDTESAVTRAQQAKSLLAELDLNTAIRLRWVMRDIRSNRTKLSPVSDNDLTALMDLGLVEMREELPRLTALGVLALD
jgi:hypothetical protein